LGIADLLRWCGLFTRQWRLAGEGINVKVGAAIDRFVRWMRGLLRADHEKAHLLAVGTETKASDPLQEALAFLETTQAKVDRLAADFNAGTINRAQFRNLYAHYQRQIQSVESMIESAPTSEDWKGAVPEGQSILIRRKHGAKAVGYAIFENESGIPISTLGQFELDPALLVPMLASYRSAAREAFGAGTRSTEMEDGRWLCFVPGEFTTMLALFTAEPAGRQLAFLGQLHRQFEQANRRHLAAPPVRASELLFPHEYYLGQWRR
jgi:hypothetical protein